MNKDDLILSAIQEIRDRIDKINTNLIATNAELRKHTLLLDEIVEDTTEVIEHINSEDDEEEY